ncbi:MAG: tetratricopeptide repeat protein [Phenylobacterium sp.]|nr:tetratricopeptide repeat protein [Phenylobacterium sp.]
MTDLFEEVEEQLRSDRYKQLARKVLPWVLGVAALALVGALAYWGWDNWRAGNTAKASEQYVAAIEALQAGDRDKALELWTETSKSQAPAYKAMSLMHLAAFQMSQNKTAEAVKLLDQAAEAAPDEVVGDAARLKSALALLDTASFADVEARLKPLMEDSRPYRMQAREALAFAKIRAGNLTGARSDFVVLSQSLDASQGAQSRAQAAIGLIDSGSAKDVANVVKAVQALPPPDMAPPGGMVGPAQPQDGAPQ